MRTPSGAVPPSCVPPDSGPPSSARPEEGAFARNAADAHAAGLVVIPTAARDAKRPLVRWGQIRRPPRPTTIGRWSAKFPNANLAYLPAPSGLVVVDVDDMADEDRARALLGIRQTSIIIVSGKRGLHFPLRSEQPIPSLDMRRFGVAGELKGAGSIVVAPGSVHPDTGRPYRFQKGDWEAFADAPVLDVEALEALVGRRLEQQGVRLPGQGQNPRGTRNGSTFAYLRSLGATGLFCSEDDVLAAARAYNAEHNDPPEPESKVLSTARSVWRYIRSGNCRAPRNAHYAGLTSLELAALRSLAPDHDYADALALFMELKRAHAARAQRGETFAIAATAMASSGIIPGWSDRKRYLRATRALLACGLIERVKGAVLQRWTGRDGKTRRRGLRAAQYRFAAVGS